MPRLRAKSRAKASPGHDGRGQDGERHDVAVRHGDDAAEQVGREVAGGVTRPEAHEERPDGHAHRPDDADGRILADAPPAPGPLDAQRRKHGEDHRPGYGVGSRVESYAQPAERGVRDAAREENHPPAYDVGAYDAARYAREDTCRQRIGQVAVLDQIAEKFHPRSLYLRANLRFLLG